MKTDKTLISHNNDNHYIHHRKKWSSFINLWLLEVEEKKRNLHNSMNSCIEDSWRAFCARSSFMLFSMMIIVIIPSKLNRKGLISYNILHTYKHKSINTTPLNIVLFFLLCSTVFNYQLIIQFKTMSKRRNQCSN